ncbi:hypothetical protein [Streptomyces sp. NPDC088755]|uniref:hypothetical protein n=1 Tax=Streptomyces sp. NPDC088755 TaxID=3365888 RepID=UPI0037FAA7EF
MANIGAPDTAPAGAHDTATAGRHALETALQPLPACTACTIGRSPHTAASAWIHPSPGLPRIMICTRHQQASSDPRHPTPLDIRAVPELTQAHLSARRPATPVSPSWASTITTPWYDHQQHVHERRHTRLYQLRATNPRMSPGPASPALTCRELITNPETLTLTAAHDHLPPNPLTHAQQTTYLHQLTGRLPLPRLAPADHDLLWKHLITH